VLKMEWVEGLTLNQFVGRYADKPAQLEALLHVWARMARYLRTAEVAHCDLQHGNVLLVPGPSAHSLALKLIDSHAHCVPALASQGSGEAGHPAYQHPHRARDGAYNLDVDRFPLLLIATALHAVRVKGRALWDKHDNGDNLLFTESDLLGPTKSHKFLDLIRSGDPLTAALADHLLKALRGGLASAPLLEEVLPEPPPAPSPARAARPPAAAPERNGGGSAGAQAALAVVPRAGPVIRRTKRKTGGGRVVACVAAAIVLLAGLGGGWALFGNRPDSPSSG